MTTMDNLPEVVSREDWLAARKELLAQEKDVTRARDRVMISGVLPISEFLTDMQANLRYDGTNRAPPD